MSRLNDFNFAYDFECARIAHFEKNVAYQKIEHEP